MHLKDVPDAMILSHEEGLLDFVEFTYRHDMMQIEAEIIFIFPYWDYEH